MAVNSLTVQSFDILRSQRVIQGNFKVMHSRPDQRHFNVHASHYKRNILP